MRLKLVLAYVGTAYCGWQIQEKPSPPPTIQGELEAALRTLTGRLIRVHGSGRTDSGVHAHGQTAHCDVPDHADATDAANALSPSHVSSVLALTDPSVAPELTSKKRQNSRACRNWHDWRHSLNAVLPRDIRVLEAQAAPPHFHARKDALHKTYAYQFWCEKTFLPPQLTPFVWACGPLNIDACRAALPCLLGEHDFAALRNAGTDVEGTRRTILAAELEELPPCEYYPPHAPMLRLTVTANGFLKQMVRNIAGLLAACGRNALAPADIPALLATGDRRALRSATAPAQGLSLVRVTYPTE